MRFFKFSSSNSTELALPPIIMSWKLSSLRILKFCMSTSTQPILLIFNTLFKTRFLQVFPIIISQFNQIIFLILQYCLVNYVSEEFSNCVFAYFFVISLSLFSKPIKIMWCFYIICTTNMASTTKVLVFVLIKSSSSLFISIKICVSNFILLFYFERYQ